MRAMNPASVTANSADELIKKVKHGNFDALQALQALAEQGLVDAQYKLADMYNYGKGVPQDYELAAEWYRKAAEQGHEVAQFELGSMYRDGRGVSQDDELAANCFHKAAEKGNRQSWRELAILVDQGNTAAMQAVKKLAVQRDAKAAVSILWNLVGRGRADALQVIKEVAEQGVAEVQYWLGVFYAIGHGMPQNYEQAMRWYRKAAEQGHADAQYKMGENEENQDHAKAVEWYCKAAEQEHKKALYVLRTMSEKGDACAAHWYRKVTARNDQIIQHLLDKLGKQGLIKKRD